ncbi:GD18516 [Drosophila simulans]|uniref:GD18516 n=1 Tax=Drosophila simulans TaxID=7240 RepID=B4QYQ1_DROSI|nr:GD18516 [Drosophila simulans]
MQTIKALLPEDRHGGGELVDKGSDFQEYASSTSRAIEPPQWLLHEATKSVSGPNMLCHLKSSWNCGIGPLPRNNNPKLA